jgi:hypothetical protein
LLPFRVHQFRLRERYYLLLPKLNPGQMRVFAERLSAKGFSVRLSGDLSAKSREGTLRIDPSGLCWSAFDPSDAVLPAVPDMLSREKEEIPLGDLEGLYFTAERARGETVIRLSPRLESGRRWDALRASGECALALDERAVASFLMERAGGPCRTLADFGTDASVLRKYGKNYYFDSYIDSTVARSHLRAAGESAPRNSYLPRDGVLRFGHLSHLTRKSWVDLFESLGEWCYYLPSEARKL